MQPHGWKSLQGDTVVPQPTATRTTLLPIPHPLPCLPPEVSETLPKWRGSIRCRMLQRHINSTHSSPPPQTLPHPAQVSFIFILLYSCFSGRCGTRTDIRLTNNAATAAKSGATSSPCSLSSLSLLPSVFIFSLSLCAWPDWCQAANTWNCT